MIEITASTAIQVIYSIYFAQEKVSVILLGPPGIGKTLAVADVAGKIAETLGRELVDWAGAGEQKRKEVMSQPEKYFVYVAFAATHLEPTDLSGIPRAEEDYFRYNLPDYLKVLTLPNIAGVLFLDEITTDPRPDRRSSELKIINEKIVGFRRLADGVLVVAAGNTKRWSQLAEELDEPMRRGRAVILFLSPPTLDEWMEWMDKTYGDRWDRRILAFLKLYSDSFFTPVKEKEDGDIESGYRALNSPRNWTKLAILLKTVEDTETLDPIISGLCEPETAVKLKAFLNTAVVDWRTIKKWNPQMPPEAKYLLLAQMASAKDLLDDRYSELLAELDNESLNLLLSLMPVEKRYEFGAYARERHPRLFRRMVRSVVKEGESFE